MQFGSQSYYQAHGKQLSMLSVIPEGNGSDREITVGEERNPIQESRDSQSFDSVQAARNVALSRMKNKTLPRIGRMREKYSDPSRFLEDPEPIETQAYADNYSRFQSNKDKLNPEVNPTTTANPHRFQNKPDPMPNEM